MPSVQDSEFVETAFTEAEVGEALATPPDAALLQACAFLSASADGAERLSTPNKLGDAVDGDSSTRLDSIPPAE